MAGRTDIERALRVYEDERRRKTAALVWQGRRTAAVMRTTNPVACYLREMAMQRVREFLIRHTS